MEIKLNFSSKGRVLESLFDKLKSGKILPTLIIKTEDFINNPEIVIKNIQSFFINDLLIIRSSAKNEDTFESSNAGKYKTISNVNKNNFKEIKKSIKKVINSYENPEISEEILIQEMLSDIIISGVIITCDIDTLSPYYIINFETGSSRDGVTGGKSNNLKTFISFKESPFPEENKLFLKLFSLCNELESLFECSNLDVEFAFDKNEELYIFQVRPVVTLNKENLSDINLKNVLEKIFKKFQKLSAPHPNILGKNTILGVMPDWNPAEIIGIRPKRLSLSLYKELITDNIWAFQRDNYGYRNLRSYPLMISLLGIPFIDTRVSFNSFIPKTLDEGIAEKLVDYYLDKLVKMPHLHDKVEFEIVHSCYYLNLSEKLRVLFSNGFNKNEIKSIELSLLEITISIINPSSGLYKKDLEKIETLKGRYENVTNSNLPIIDKIFWLIEDCKRYGTLPFAGIARAAFIAVQFLKSFIDCEIITIQEYDLFMNSLNTVSKQLNFSLYNLSKGKIDKESFLKKYGHLRPGTYDITSLSYEEGFDTYFSTENAHFEENSEFSFSEKQLKMIEKNLIENGINLHAKELLNFITEAIEGREYSKFIFTRSLSKILKLIEELAGRFGISRDDSAFINIREILELYSTLDHRDIKETLSHDINKNKDFYRYTKAVKLPGLIVFPEDVYRYYTESNEPNFITLKRIEAEIILENELNYKDPQGKIIIIESADPGYDFLFTKKIAGLITQFGGANSHMAIRCAESGLPAVIGAGENNFIKWSKSKIINIDCSNKKVIIIL